MSHPLYPLRESPDKSAKGDRQELPEGWRSIQQDQARPPWQPTRGESALFGAMMGAAAACSPDLALHVVDELDHYLKTPGPTEAPSPTLYSRNKPFFVWRRPMSCCFSLSRAAPTSSGSVAMSPCQIFDGRYPASTSVAA